MGVTVQYRRMSESELDRLEADPLQAMMKLIQNAAMDNQLMAKLLQDPVANEERIAKLLDAMQNNTLHVDLEKDWHALHYLLTGDDCMEPAHDPDNPLTLPYESPQETCTECDPESCECGMNCHESESKIAVTMFPLRKIDGVGTDTFCVGGTFKSRCRCVKRFCCHHVSPME